MIFWKTTTAPPIRHLGFFFAKWSRPSPESRAILRRTTDLTTCSYRLLMVLISNFDVSTTIDLSCSTRRAESNGTSQLKIWWTDLEIKVRATAVARDLKIACSRFFWCLSCSTRRVESNGTSQLKIWPFFKELWAKQNFEQPLLENVPTEVDVLSRTYPADHYKSNAKDRIKICWAVIEIWLDPGQTFFALTR